ncbi:MAG: type 4 prepilin peptidase 1, Aspartic peptidase family [Thermoleophilia bacterium]|nr:type 4 prepilin peptidase 1, Aspartic peptidase family [Thermoleophilia bacterium]
MDHRTIWIVYAAVFGLLIGSFLNVVIARLAVVDWRERGSLGGRSACPKCGHHITWYENIPLLSWLALRGRCRGCKERISVQYPLVEAGTSLAWLAVALTADSVADLVTGVIFLTLLIPISVIDLKLRIIPDELNTAIIWLGFACSLGFGPRPRFLGVEWWWVEVLVSAIGASLFLLLPYLFTKRGGMGFGDVKLVLGLGAFLGAPVAVGLFAGFLAGLVPSIYLLATRGLAKGRKSAIPFGPFLALGGAFGWFYGPEILDAYLRVGT